MAQNLWGQLNKRNNRGQAILELAVFGSIVLMLLGILVNYALRYNFQQQVTMRAFRKALASAAVSSGNGYPNSTSHLVIRDRHIPDPGGFLAIGSVASVSSAASVTRNYRLHAVAEQTSELPKMVIDINGARHTYTQAGKWTDGSVSEDELKKFQEVFGDSNLIYDTNDDGKFEGGAVTVIDSNHGQILDYSAARRTCRQVTEIDFCTSECEQGRWAPGEESCSTLCSYSIDTPPYCGQLDSMFAFTQTGDGRTIPKTMGVQSDYEQTYSNTSSLQKNESHGGVTTDNNRNWESYITRTIRHKAGADTSQSVIGQNQTTSWQTSW